MRGRGRVVDVGSWGCVESRVVHGDGVRGEMPTMDQVSIPVLEMSRGVDAARRVLGHLESPISGAPQAGLAEEAFKEGMKWCRALEVSGTAALCETGIGDSRE